MCCQATVGKAEGEAEWSCGQAQVLTACSIETLCRLCASNSQFFFQCHLLQAALLDSQKIVLMRCNLALQLSCIANRTCKLAPKVLVVHGRNGKLHGRLAGVRKAHREAKKAKSE